MTVFRNNAEPDPMPATTAQLDQQAAELAGKQPGPRVAFATGQDAGLSQSLADLRKGYENAAKVQSEAGQQAALNRAMVDAQIDENTPHPSVNFVDHRPEQYVTGDSRQVPSSDPVWKMPLDHLRTNLELTQDMYQAVDRLSKTGGPKDFQIAAELGDRLQTSMARDFTTQQIDWDAQQPQQQRPQEQPQTSTQARPETFPDGSLYQISDLPDGQLQVQLVTGEIFKGDPLTVTKKIAEAKVHTTRWGQEWRQKAQAQPQNGNGSAPPLVPSSQVQYDP
jgi:hypothetical protein